MIGGRAVQVSVPTESSRPEAKNNESKEPPIRARKMKSWPESMHEEEMGRGGGKNSVGK